MSARDVTILGTASQVPTRYRNHNGYLLSWDGLGILFDPGEGTQRQMVRAGKAAHDLTHICITHFHGDHCLGLAGVIQRISLDQVPHPVHIHYPKSGQKYFDRLRRASIFVDRSHIVPCPIAEDGPIDELPRGAVLETLSLDHGVPTHGYRLVEADGVRMLPEELEVRGIRGRDIGRLQREGSVIAPSGQRVDLSEVSSTRRGQRVALVMDTRLCDNAFRLAEGADLLVCESTYLESEASDARKNGHLTARQAARIAAESGVRRLVLTHFSQRYPRVEAFVEEARALHDDVVAVRDGDVVPVPKRVGSNS